MDFPLHGEWEGREERKGARDRSEFRSRCTEGNKLRPLGDFSDPSRTRRCLSWWGIKMDCIFYENLLLRRGAQRLSHKYSNIYIYIYLGMRYLSIFFFSLFAILLFVNCSMNKCAKMKKRIRKRRISKEKCKSIGNRMTRRYVRMGSWTFQSRTIFLGVVETYARFEARSKQNDFAGYPLTCEVKIRFSRAFHTSRTIRHPVHLLLKYPWWIGALIFHNRGESIMSINFNYSRKRKCVWRDRLLTDTVYKSFDNLSFKIFNFCRIEFASNFSK